jgi:hypothetical protein
MNGRAVFRAPLRNFANALRSFADAVGNFADVLLDFRAQCAVSMS